MPGLRCRPVHASLVQYAVSPATLFSAVSQESESQMFYNVHVILLNVAQLRCVAQYELRTAGDWYHQRCLTVLGPEYRTNELQAGRKRPVPIEVLYVLCPSSVGPLTSSQRLWSGCSVKDVA